VVSNQVALVKNTYFIREMQVGVSLGYPLTNKEFREAKNGWEALL
jgi:hypothetical protein